MGYQELIEALKIEAQEQIDQIWKDARDKARQIEEELNKNITSLREMHEEEYNRLLKEKTSHILFDAHEKARQIRLNAEEYISERLLCISHELLPLLRRGNYKGIFHDLAEEIPEERWQTVRVNPEDVELARELFPSCEIVEDENITGGLDLTTDDGKIRIINTFEKRLERAWPEILPEIMKEIKEAIK